MVTDWEIVLPGIFALAGVLVGGWVNGRSEASRWRRDYLISRINGLRDHFADLVEAVDTQFRVTAQVVEQMKGLRDPVPKERIDAAGVQWARAFSRKSVESPANVQQAIVAFDLARNRVALAINARTVREADTAMHDLDTARKAVIEEINAILNAMNDSLVPLLMRRHERLWKRVQGRPMLGDPDASP